MRFFAHERRGLQTAIRDKYQLLGALMFCTVYAWHGTYDATQQYSSMYIERWLCFTTKCWSAFFSLPWVF